MCSLQPTFYRVCAKRGSLLANVAGIVVHDHWKPYYTMQGVLHALCNAHHLRELKALVEIEKEEWARKMQRLLRRACHAANRARERGVAMKPRLIECFERRYDAILAEGLAFHEAKRRWRAPPRREAANGAAARLAEPDTISSCASRRAKRTRCASFTMLLFPSPTTKPNATGA